jgi:hypothetical protein
VDQLADNQAAWTQFIQKILVLACAIGPSVTTFSSDFSFQNLVFWNLFEVSLAEMTLKSMSPIF